MDSMSKHRNSFDILQVKNANSNMKYKCTQAKISIRIIRAQRVDLFSMVPRLEACVAEIMVWMNENYLKLNESKTEFIVLGSVQQRKLLSLISHTSC